MNCSGSVGTRSLDILVVTVFLTGVVTAFLARADGATQVAATTRAGIAFGAILMAMHARPARQPLAGPSGSYDRAGAG
jgi:ABC-type transport system involved in cytochrome c biogenesis permease subunit